MWKQRGIIISLLVVMLTACSTAPDSKESSAVQVEKKEETHLENRLISAAAEGDTETVIALIESGANIDAIDNQGNTAVMAATQRNHVDLVKTLIEHGADINIRNHNLDNVLLYAGAAGYLEIVQLAVQAGADTTLTNRYGGIAIIPASERGHVEVVEELVTNSDTDVNHINNLHWTALLEAVILGDGGERHQKIVQLLVDHGADVNIADRDGVTPLEHAERRGYNEIQQILKEAGA
ncbi:ankyrin repeat domain-containing protein [Sporosarcina sp. NCCP-2222]|uniref:ankyrin repeat domain-containing protein n=1 Tax=Sporosarcina sp. NCCP-2222 TaxID=2935073 RepID=UPI0035D0AE71